MMRRDFFAETAGIATFLAAAAQPLVAGRSDIKIVDIKTFVVGVGSRNLVFVKVETDQGIPWCSRQALGRPPAPLQRTLEAKVR